MQFCVGNPHTHIHCMLHDDDRIRSSDCTFLNAHAVGASNGCWSLKRTAGGRIVGGGVQPLTPTAYVCVLNWTYIAQCPHSSFRSSVIRNTFSHSRSRSLCFFTFKRFARERNVEAYKWSLCALSHRLLPRGGSARVYTNREYNPTLLGFALKVVIHTHTHPWANTLTHKGKLIRRKVRWCRRETRTPLTDLLLERSESVNVCSVSHRPGRIRILLLLLRLFLYNVLIHISVTLRTWLELLKHCVFLFRGMRANKWNIYINIVFGWFDVRRQWHNITQPIVPVVFCE